MCSTGKNIMPKGGDGKKNNINIDASGGNGGTFGDGGKGGNVHIGDRKGGSHGK
jgi:hypothetical protein